MRSPDIYARLAVVVFILFFAGESAATLVVTPQKVDKGYVRRDRAQKDFILLRNEGTAAVEITGVVNGCGLTLHLPRRVLQPAQSTEGILEFFSGTVIGPLTGRVIILYRHAGESTLRERAITVSWLTVPDIYSEVQVSPQLIDIGDVPSDTVRPFVLEFHNFGTVSDEIRVMKSDGGISVPFPFIVPPGVTKRLRGTLFTGGRGETTRKIYFESRQVNAAPLEVIFKYNAVSGLKTGAYLEIGEPEKTAGSYRLPVTIHAGEGGAHFVAAEDGAGNKRSLSEALPVMLGRNEGRRYYIEFDTDAFKAIEKSFIYLTVGIKAAESTDLR